MIEKIDGRDCFVAPVFDCATFLTDDEFEIWLGSVNKVDEFKEKTARIEVDIGSRNTELTKAKRHIPWQGSIDQASMSKDGQ